MPSPSSKPNSPLRKARQARGLSLKQAAAKIGVHFTVLSRIENGRPATPAVARRMYDFYRGRVSWAHIYNTPTTAEARRR